MLRWIGTGLLAASALALAGCNAPEPIEPDPAAPLAATPEASIVDWPYWPTSIRVHPLTRLAPRDEDPEKLLIEARIELTDADGHSSRGCGQLQIRMFNLDAPDTEEPVPHWKLDLRDRAFNSERFDPVTQTYLFRLEVEPEQLEGTPELRAYYLTGQGTALEVDRLLLRTE
jgi:hypothetical protein